MTETTIAGQRRTNPWTTVPDWILMPECRCRTEAADYWKKCWWQTNFSPAFTFHYLQFGRALGVPFTTTTNSFFKCRKVGLFGIQSVRYRNEQKFRYWNQSDRGIRGPSPVPDCYETGLKYRMPECRCPAIETTVYCNISFRSYYNDYDDFFCTKNI